MAQLFSRIQGSGLSVKEHKLLEKENKLLESLIQHIYHFGGGHDILRSVNNLKINPQ